MGLPGSLPALLILLGRVRENKRDRKGKRRKGGNKDVKHRSEEHAQRYHLFLLSWNIERP